MRLLHSDGCEQVTNVDDSLDGAYLEWLYSQVGIVQNRNPARSHWKLLFLMYTTQYRWFIPNDDNRVEDGKALRLEFLRQTRFQLDDPYGLWINLECSMLEMIVALAQRVAFESDGSSAEWFWRLMHNLELDGYTDAIWEIAVQEEVEEVLERINSRKYNRSGTGGLFPLRTPEHDQRKVELWYQMQAYLFEGLYVNIRPRF